MYFVYNVLLLLTAPLWWPWMLWRTSRRAEKPNWKERCGDYSRIEIPAEQPAIWIHAVSVGEVLAALPILRQVKALLPEHFVLLSVTTSSGHRTASEHGVGAFDALAYFPLDLARFQLSAMMRIRPDVVAIMETELWFNFLWAAKAMGAQTMLLNGRISDRSYPRSKALAFFYRPMLRMMDGCLMQTEVDAERIRTLGGMGVEVFGNVKFDEAIDGLNADRGWWMEALGLDAELPTIVVGSSRGEEEEQLIGQALRDVKRPFNLVWAPRHLERAEAVAELLQGFRPSVARRSMGARGDTVVLDTYGELSKAYAVADAVVVGGGFANLGGQNLLQPLAHGKPVLHGPYMQNFRAVTEAAQSVGATIECPTAGSLGAALARLLDSPSECEAMGAAGADLVRRNEGASRRYAEAIAEAASRPTRP